MRGGVQIVLKCSHERSAASTSMCDYVVHVWAAGWVAECVVVNEMCIWIEEM